MCNFESLRQPKRRQIFFALKLNMCFSIRSKFKNCPCQTWRFFWYVTNFTFKGIYNPIESMYIKIWKVVRERLSEFGDMFYNCILDVSKVIFSQSSKNKANFEKEAILFCSAFCLQYWSFNPNADNKKQRYASTHTHDARLLLLTHTPELFKFVKIIPRLWNSKLETSLLPPKNSFLPHLG